MGIVSIPSLVGVATLILILSDGKIVITSLAVLLATKIHDMVYVAIFQNYETKGKKQELAIFFVAQIIVWPLIYFIIKYLYAINI